MLSTWFFNGEEWAGLTRRSPRARLVDYLLAEPAFSPGHFPIRPRHIPRRPSLPLVGFPEISMVGWPGLGGFGANPLPTRYEREWKELKAQWQGGFPYSRRHLRGHQQGPFRELLLEETDTTADEALREYIAFEYSPEVVDLVLPAIRMLEKNVPSGRVGRGRRRRAT